MHHYIMVFDCVAGKVTMLIVITQHELPHPSPTTALHTEPHLHNDSQRVRSTLGWVRNG